MKTVTRSLLCIRGNIEWCEHAPCVITEQAYRGGIVQVECFENDQFKSCLDNEHDLEVVHHYDDDGKHYCPTGLLLCQRCFGSADEPEPHACILWGEAKPGLTDFVCHKHRPEFDRQQAAKALESS